MGLLYVVSTCSAHCRFCYREELIARKEVERQDGTVEKKGIAKIPDVVAYMRAHNAAVAANGGVHPENGTREAARDVAVRRRPDGAPNSKLAAWFTALAEAGAEAIRVGTKELAFHPDRFDDAFLSMLDNFHDAYSRSRPQADDPLQPSRRGARQDARRRLRRRRVGRLRVASEHAPSDGCGRVPGLDQRRKSVADHRRSQ